jgi:hypothetical protein
MKIFIAAITFALVASLCFYSAQSGKLIGQNSAQKKLAFI